MHNFYIKMVYGSRNPDGRPWREGGEYNLHFAEEQRTICNRFTDATAFLVYETGQHDGARTIFGSGTVLSLSCANVWAEDPVEDSTGKKYPLGVRVQFDKLVPPKQGVPLDEIYKLCHRLTNHFKQAMGGLIGITAEEYSALNTALSQR